MKDEFAPIFKDAEFSITPEDIPQAREKVQEEYRLSQNRQADETNHPDIQSYGKGSEDITRERAIFWAKHEDEEIFEMAQALYDQGRSLEDSGLSDEEIAKQLRDDPNRRLIEPLLRDKTWGHSLEDSMAKLAIKEFQDPTV